MFVATRQGIFKDFDGTPRPAESIPWLYRDFDDVSAEALQGLDDELQAIKRALASSCPEVPSSFRWLFT